MLDLYGIGILDHAYYEFTTHTHTCWEITYYLEGSGTAIIGQKSIPFRARDILIKPPHIPHSETSTDGFRNIFLWLDGLELFREQPILLRDLESQYLQQLLMQLALEFHTQRKNRPQILRSLLDVFYQYAVSLCSESERNPYVEIIKNQIVANLSNPHFDLNAVIGTIPTCKDHFRRIFKQETGLTPLQYLQEKRMSYAEQLLSSSYVNGLTVKQVSAMVGFQDQLYFSRAFRKHKGKSPIQWFKSL